MEVGDASLENGRQRIRRRECGRGEEIEKNILEKTTGLGLRTSEEGKVRWGKKNTRGSDATGVFGHTGHTHLDRMFRKY